MIDLLPLDCSLPSEETELHRTSDFREKKTKPNKKPNKTKNLKKPSSSLFYKLFFQH